MNLTPVVVAAACLGSLASAQPRSTIAPKVRVCDLLREPERYNGNLVEVRAQTSASEEGAVIFDQHCSGSILFLLDSGDGSASRQLAKLMKSHASVGATLVGVFEHAAVRKFGHQGAWDSRFHAKSVSDLRADELGWLVGTVAMFGDGGFEADAAKATVIVACKDQRTVIKADEHGDYGILLEPCEYQLRDVVASGGEKLGVHSRQARTFVIKRGGRTRFDVMVTR